MGVVVTEIIHFVILMVGTTVFMLYAVQQHGGWNHILERISTIRPEALQSLPPVYADSPKNSIELATIALLVLQGFFFAGSPTAGEGSTAQRFMSARNEAHAMAGQLFNCFLALTLRILPLIGIGLVCMSIFWPESLAKVAPVPEGMTAIDPDYAWAEMVKHCIFPVGFVGLLISVEVAAYTSTLSTLINWGGSFVINDIYRPLDPNASVRREIWVSRLTTLFLFLAASAVAILFVHEMIGWFMFINAAMVIFLLPLAVFRFFWWRFNVWGELAAIVLGLPISIYVWFILDFQNENRHPMWQGLGLLFVLSFVVLIAVTLLTPPESPETLQRFYRRCRPPGWWGAVRNSMDAASIETPPTKTLLVNSALGVFACLGLVLATNAIFVSNWPTIAICLSIAIMFSATLIFRVLRNPTMLSPAARIEAPPLESLQATETAFDL